MRIKLLFLFAVTLITSTVKVNGQATDLIISEYVEGSASNKYIELYNGTAAAIDLANYQLLLYSNGSGTATIVDLSGMIAAGGTAVFRNVLATIYTGTTTNNNACNFNGDDAVVLRRDASGSYAPVDIFGKVACDPGSAWLATGLSTANRTLRRKPNICSGVTSNPTAACGTASFTTLASEWDGDPIDDVSGLGSHVMTCGPTVNFSTTTPTLPTTSSSANEAAGTQTITMTLAPATTVAGTVTITVSGTGTATYGGGADYTTTPAGATTFTVNVGAMASTATFNINVTDDLVSEPDETIIFTITGTGGGISPGVTLEHTHTIINDDYTPTVNFTTPSTTVLENVGTVVYNLSITPGYPGGPIVINVTNFPGAVYGTDYTTNPAGGGGTITLNRPPGATTASFTTTVINDVLAESTETVGFEITSVPPTAYIGGENTSALIIGDNDSPPAVLYPGDLVVVGVNANLNGCNGTIDDEISFFCFKEITFGTQIILTDNGYERTSPGLWGDSEGFVRMTRTGAGIPAGTVITLRAPNTTVPNFIAPDANWSCVNYGPNALNLNSGGDQLFFMQDDGTGWSDPAGDHNASFSGEILFGFSSVAPPNSWVANGSTQRSNLPIGLECFSMAPTAASDFAKYKGPITPATQRDWIIRVDNPLDWQTYTQCTDYVVLGHDWRAAPVLPIIDAPIVPGRWRGTTNVDWFNCKNWDDVTVPTATTDVTIDAAYTQNNCYVGWSGAGAINPNGTGVCASVSLTSNVGVAKALIVDANSTLNIGGPLSVVVTSPGTAMTAQLNANSALNATDLYLEGPAATNFGRFYSQNSTAIPTFTGNVTIAPGGLLNLGSAVLGGRIRIGGNYENQGTDVAFNELNSTVEFIDAGPSTISIATGSELFSTLLIGKSGTSNVTLNNSIRISKALELENGLLNSSATAMPTLLAGGIVNGGANNSFVNGPMQKQGTTDFTFPIGKGSRMRPAGISSITGGATGTFIAEYFPADPTLVYGTPLEPTLDHVSHCEYWLIDRTVGAASARIELTWDDATSCGVTNLPDLRIARWDIANTIWRDRGVNPSPTGTLLSGLIATAAIEPTASFNPDPGPTAWTLASSTDENPLPIELISFTAENDGPWVRLDWVTASERNNDYFTIERSADGIHFTDILEELGAGNSLEVLHYLTFDREPMNGVSYYRLRQTDFDGTTEVSQIVPLYRGTETDRPLVVYGNADVVTVLHGFAPESTYELIDMTGRLIDSGSVQQEGQLEVTVSGLQRGAYLFRLSNGQLSESVRFVY